MDRNRNADEIALGQVFARGQYRIVTVNCLPYFEQACSIPFVDHWQLLILNSELQ